MFGKIIAAIGIEEMVPSDLVTVLQELVGRVWEHVIIAGLSNDPPKETDDHIFIDFDQAVRRTYDERSSVGIPLRRAFIGVPTSAVELCGVNPYNRLADGVVRICDLYSHS